MKRLSKILFLTFFLCSATAFGSDRSSIVQGRIQGALNNVLPKTDYLVIVNRLDDLETGGLQAALSGEVRSLPGLSVGVDSRGEIVNRDGAFGEYNGPIAINLIIDPAVRAETFELIKKTVPELSGGLRDLDEFKVTRASLRQAALPNPNAPQVNVTNQASQNGWADLVRHAAVLLLLGGMLIWFLSRMSAKDSKPSSSSPSPAERAPSKSESEPSPKISFGDLDPAVVGLYLLKELHERRPDKVAVYSTLTAPAEQRKVLKSIPGWAASYLEKEIRKKADENFADDGQMAAIIYNEIAVIELNLTDDIDHHRSFLSWFPAPSLRMVSREHLHSLTDSSKKTLLKLRHDLGNLVKVDTLDLESAMEPTTDAEIRSCFAELKKWKSSDVHASRELDHDLVGRLAIVINNLTEFGPIAQQVEQAKAKLSKSDFARLQNVVVTAESPLLWSEAQVKDWLRTVEPSDYQWWLSVVSTAPKWELSKLLRPLRLSMFNRASASADYKVWREDEKKAAATRILQQLRVIHQQAEISHHVEAA